MIASAFVLHVIFFSFVFAQQEQNQMHIGLVSIGLLGHIRPLTYIAQELNARGHKVTFYIPENAMLVHNFTYS